MPALDPPNELLRYSALSEYKVPSERSAAAMRRVRRIWRRVKSALRSRGPAEDGEREDLDPAASQVPDEALPRFEVEAATDALAAALDGWPDGDSDARCVRVVVGPPGTRVQEVVAGLARRRGWTAIDPPGRAELLRGPEAVRERASEIRAGATEPAVVRRLERWLLRSETALPATRALLEALRTRRSPLLIACDSWAWSFLDRALGAADLFGEPLALAPLDGVKLAQWLGAPMSALGLTCRPDQNRDETIFDPDSESGSARILSRLAAATRGNPGVALELWSRSLQRAPDSERTVWVLPPVDAELDLPDRLEALHDFILHAVLLHGGLDPELLLDVLPFPRHDLLRRLSDLTRARVLAARSDGGGGELSVPPAAYAQVRERMVAEGLLVDDF